MVPYEERMQLIDSLQSLGLNEKQAKVYLALLKLGRASAYAASGEAGLKKPTTYVIIGELVEKGLVTKVPRSRTQLFQAKSPDECFALAQERLSLAKKVLPELMALSEGTKPNVRTLLFEGIDGMREVLWFRMEVLKGQELVGVYASTEDASAEYRALVRAYHDAQQASGQRVRALVPRFADTSTVSEHSSVSELKVIPFSDLPPHVSIDVGDTFVRIVAFADLQAVIIEHPEGARMLRALFELVWNAVPAG